MTALAIQTTNLSHNFGSLRALDNISFEVQRGTIFGFLGPNGAGKTTTIHLLLGLLQPRSGQIEVLGLNPLTHAGHIRQQCGALLEHNGLYERMSAYENLEFYARIWRLPARIRQARIQELLESLQLWDRRKEITGTWSRGMKQKLALARTLLHRPALVFLDEPTAGLDPLATASVREDLQNLANSQGVTIFLTTHNLTEAEKICRQIAVIRRGRLLAAGSPQELRQGGGKPSLEITGTGFDETVLYTLQALPGIESLQTTSTSLRIIFNQPVSSAPLVNLLVGLGVQIEEVRKGKNDFEDAFLSLLEEEPTA
jgi:ABC-2 type transport system ATP-binding protein